MVVLDGHGTNSVLSGTSGGPHQYLQPDYMTPLPTMLDAKKSPLALLVQTCSQIGADSPSSNNKFESSSQQRRKHSLNSDTDSLTRPRSSGSNCSITSTASTSSHSPPYSKQPVHQQLQQPSSLHSVTHYHQAQNGKTSPPTGNNRDRDRHHHQPSSKSKSCSNTNSSNLQASLPLVNDGGRAPTERLLKRSSSASTSPPMPSKMSRVSPPVSSASSTASSDKDTIILEKKDTPPPQPPSEKEHSRGSGSRKSPHNSSSSSSPDEKSSSKSSKPQPPQDPQGANPIIRSGLEILHGNRYPGVPLPPSLAALSGHPPTSSAGLGYPADFLNPAFRLPYLGGGGPQQAHPYLSAYPQGSPYLSYSRVKTPQGESIVPVCKDPYCTGCQYGGGGAGLLSQAYQGFPQGGICPIGCASCDHQKIPYPSPFGFGGYHPALFSQHAALYQQQQQQQQQAAAVAAAQQQQQQQQQQQHNAARPNVCNWIVGENYCGKRFATSEELLQHLRTHTNNAAAASDSATLAAFAAHQQQQFAAALAASGASSMYTNSAMAMSMSPMAAAAMAMQMRGGYPNPSQISPYGVPVSSASASGNSGQGGSAGAKPGSIPPGYYPPGAAYAAALYGQRVGPSVLQ